MSGSDADDLILFARVARHGGFSAAERALGLPKSRLSRRLTALEERLGARLVQRNSRGFALTAIGEQVLARAERILADIEATTALVDGYRAEPQGILRVSCPVTVSEFWFSPLLPAFLAGHPKVQVVLETTNRRVDLIAERIDVALRVRHGPVDEPDCIVRKVMDAPDVLVASPERLAAVRGSGPDVLATEPTLAMADAETDIWRLTDPSGVVHDVRHGPRLVSNDMGALRQAALAGAGIALMPLMACADDLAAGRLLELLPGWDAGAGVLQVAYPSRRGIAAPVRAMVDYLVTAATGVKG